MYEKFNVYFGRVEYEEKTDGKDRPVVIIDIDDENKDIIYMFGIYSYKKYFDSQKDMKTLYEVKDLDVAGLDRRSFVRVSRPIDIEIKKLRTYKHLGQLSKRDIKGLIAKEREYTYLTQLDDFLKTLDI
jgi:hypothetical protein